MCVVFSLTELRAGEVPGQGSAGKRPAPLFGSVKEVRSEDFIQEVSLPLSAVSAKCATYRL